MAWRIVTVSELTKTGLLAGKTFVESALTAVAAPLACFETSCAITSPVARAVPARGENSITFAFSVCPSATTAGIEAGLAGEHDLIVGDVVVRAHRPRVVLRILVVDVAVERRARGLVRGRIEVDDEMPRVHLALDRRGLLHHHVVVGLHVGDLLVGDADAEGVRHEVAIRRTFDHRVRRAGVADEVQRADLPVRADLAPETVRGDGLASRGLGRLACGPRRRS